MSNLVVIDVYCIGICKIHLTYDHYHSGPSKPYYMCLSDKALMNKDLSTHSVLFLAIRRRTYMIYYVKSWAENNQIS
jgi:hypothetical protein